MRIVDAYQLQEEQNGDRAWLIRCGMHCQMIGTIVNPFVFSYYGMSKLYLFYSHNSQNAAAECCVAARSVLPLRRWLSKQQTMAEYMPHIRSMCLHDQGVVNRGRTLRSRRRRRYLLCTDEEREVLLLAQRRGVNDPVSLKPTLDMTRVSFF